MNQHDAAERQYQQGRHFHDARDGERRENLLHAIDCYEAASQSYTFDAFPEKWEELQQQMMEAYHELGQMRRMQAQVAIFPSRPFGRAHFTWRERLVFGLMILISLALPTTAITRAYLEQGEPSCISGTLTIDGSTVLQPLVEAVAEVYMHHCPNAVITVGGGISKTGLADVEQGHNVVSSINPGQDHGHITGCDVPIQIGNSDVFASPAQHDLVDHQIAIGIFVMILNREVTGLNNLTTTQLRGIYTGTYQNWRQICSKRQCGPDLPILPISHTTDPGTRFPFEKYVLGGVVTVPDMSLAVVRSSGTAVQEVANNPGSIGYASLYQADQASREYGVTLVSVNGLDPRNTSLVQRNHYQFWTIEHMYTHGQGSPLAQAFLDYMYSDTVQHLLSRYALLRLTDVPQKIREDHMIGSQ